MRDVAGRTAFITGAASGIGLALARALGDAGMNVVVADSSRAHHGIAVSVVCPGTVDTRLHESEAHRPVRYAGTVDEATARIREAGGELFRHVLPMGMDPRVVAERVLRGIRADAFYIFPHVEVEPDVRESFEEMLAAFTDDPPDPELERLEDTRRRRKRKVSP